MIDFSNNRVSDLYPPDDVIYNGIDGNMLAEEAFKAFE